MHELSIALSLVEVAEAAARDARVTQVEAVHLRLGAMSGVVKEALLFSYEVATEGTLLAGSRLEIEDVPVVIYCDQCQVERVLPGVQSFFCPVCDTPALTMLQGKEIELKYLEVADEPAPTA